jgi:hypothetical protein
MAIKPNSKIFIGGNSNEFKAIQLPNYTNDNTWSPSIGGSIRYERWGSSTFKMAYIDDDNIVIGVNGLSSINSDNITQVGSVDANTGATSPWRQNKIYSGDYVHALLNTNDWLYLSASSVRFARFEKQHLPYPKVSINDVSKTECTTPTLTNEFNFTLTLDKVAPTEGSTVYYTINDGTAKTSDNDYIDKEGTIFFNAGEISKSLTITINCDAKVEQDETFSVLLSNPLNLIIADTEGIGTIKNDDSLITTSTNLSVGNRVWVDTNKNGIQDTNEVGYTGTTVNIYNNNNCVGAILATTTTTNGIYSFTNLVAGSYCLAFINLPSNYIITSANQGTDDTLNSDANTDAKITDINLISDSDTYDIGIYATSTIINQPTVEIGNRVWIENDNDGNASTGIITPVTGQLVIATSSNGIEYSAITDNNGIYLITVPQNDTYIVSLNVPSNHVATENSSNNRITESILENNLSHDANGTTVVITTIDNLTVDFGFRLINVLATTVCQEMTLNDDIQAANESNATTTIDVLSNDTGSKASQEIKFLSLLEGKSLWESGTKTITSVTTLDTLIVPGEGTWSVKDNKVVFTALITFDGQIPSSVYYIVEGSNCTVDTQYTNVAKVTINTPCNCSIYSTKSVNTLNLLSILLLIVLTTGITILSLRTEKKPMDI